MKQPFYHLLLGFMVFQKVKYTFFGKHSQHLMNSLLEKFFLTQELFQKTLFWKIKKRTDHLSGSFFLLLFIPFIYPLGFMSGKKIVSRRFFCSVNIATSLSIPIPNPVIGGIPCSIAVMNLSSTSIASSSPAVFAFD